MSTFHPLNLPSTIGIKLAIDLDTNRLYIKSMTGTEYTPVYDKEYVVVSDSFPETPIENILYIKPASDNSFAEIKTYINNTWITLTSETAAVINNSNLNKLVSAEAISSFVEQKISNLVSNTNIVENNITVANNESLPTTQAVSTFVENKFEQVPETFLTNIYNKSEIDNALLSKLDTSVYALVSR